MKCRLLHGGEAEKSQAGFVQFNFSKPKTTAGLIFFPAQGDQGWTVSQLLEHSEEMIGSLRLCRSSSAFRDLTHSVVEIANEQRVKLLHGPRINQRSSPHQSNAEASR